MRDISQIIEKQRAFFSKGYTRSYEFRCQQLRKLKDGILKFEEEILLAGFEDLHRSNFESYLFEIASQIGEINFALKNLKKWMKPKKVKRSLLNFGKKCCIFSEPLGVVCIVGAFNFSFYTSICPLIGVIAAGNCAIIKPSEHAKKASHVMYKMIKDIFKEDYITVLEGDAEFSSQLVKHPFDCIMFTGGTLAGKKVYQAAAKNLTPVVLELGGKCPCIVDDDINLEFTAQSIVLGKFTNAGQGCGCIDYLLVKDSVKNKLIGCLKKELINIFGSDLKNSLRYARIIDKKNWNRLVDLLEEGTIVYGGKKDVESLYIEPTIIDNISTSDKLMKEEIFGPILPVLTFSDITEIKKIISYSPNPLFVFYFSGSKRKQDWIVKNIQSGNGCFNDCAKQLISFELSFGGVGSSGLGRYKGKSGFDSFSNKKSFTFNKIKSQSVFLYFMRNKKMYPIMKFLMRFILGK